MISHDPVPPREPIRDLWPDLLGTPPDGRNRPVSVPHWATDGKLALATGRRLREYRIANTRREEDCW
jgi:hypothetical protein